MKCFIFVLLLAGCDYVPNKEYELETTDGQKITFLCPLVDKDRSVFTYIIAHECRLISVREAP